MSSAQLLASSTGEPLRWEEICKQHPGEWVCLTGVEHQLDGAVRSAWVIAHDRSMRKMLAEVGAHVEMVFMHTGGRPLSSPRVELTREIRDIVRPRR